MCTSGLGQCYSRNRTLIVVAGFVAMNGAQQLILLIKDHERLANKSFPFCWHST